MSRTQFIFITIFLDALGIGLLVPVLPEILGRFAVNAAELSFYYGLFLSTYAAIQFLASPLLGSLSDRFGRRPVLLISLLGAGLDYLLMAFAPTLIVLFIGRAISGLTGASMTVASSYMADISNDSNRSKNFALIGAAWGLGFIIGPLMGGLLGNLGHNGPFLVAAGMNLINFAFGFFILPESLTIENRRSLSFRGLNPFVSMAKVLRLGSTSGLVWMYGLTLMAGQVHAVNWALFTQLKFAWTSWEIGVSLAFFGITTAACQILLPRFLVPAVGEFRTAMLGLLLASLAFILLSFITEAWMIYPLIALFACSSMTAPAIQSILSKDQPAGNQGELQGTLVSLGSLCAVIAPFLFSQIFIRFTATPGPGYFPGAAYFAAGTVCLLAFAIGAFTPFKAIFFKKARA